MRVSIAVVGGGISGLSTAYFLKRNAAVSSADIKCIVIDGAKRLGGRIQTELVDGLVVEAGPDSFLALKPNAVELCKQLGLSESLIGSNASKSKIYILHSGKLRPLPEGMASSIPTKVMPFLSNSLFTPWGKARMLMDIFIPSRIADGDESLAEFTRRRLGREALERVAKPLMAGIYAGDAERLSVRSNFPQLERLEREHRSLILGTLADRRRNNGTNAGKGSAFMSLRGGLSVMVSALESKLDGEGTSILKGSPAVRINARRGKSGGYSIGLHNGKKLNVDVLVLATPAYVSADLLSSLSPDASSILNGIPYASSATVSLAYNRPDLPQGLDGSGFLVAPSERVSITACTWVSSKWPSHSPDDKVMLRCFIGRAGADDVVKRGDSEIFSMVKEDLRSILSISAEPVMERVYRHERALPQYNIGHMERMALLNAAMEKLPGIYLTGSAYNGVGIPDCIRHGELTAAKVLESLAGQ